MVYNMVNPLRFSWTDLLKELRDAGLEFEEVPATIWLSRLRHSAEMGDEERNPAVKLLDYFEQHFMNHSRGIIFDTTAIQRDCDVLRASPRMIEDGYVRKFLTRWLQSWRD